MGEDFDYAEEFKTLDVEALKRDLIERDDDVAGLVAGRLRPLRAALHPDDVARRRHVPHRRRPRRRRRRRAALRPAQQLARQREPRQGAPAALADQAEVRPEDLLGRPARLRRQRAPWSRWASRRSASASAAQDIWEPEEIFWGPEDTWLGDERYSGDRELAGPFGAVQMGLIYVNPEGPNGNPDPLAAARDIRETFAPHGDERRGDGRAHRRRPHVRQDATVRRRRRARRSGARGLPRSRQQGLGWKNSFGTGKGGDTITSGLEGAWTNDPTKWDNGFLENLFGYEWELTESPAGAKQWTPKNPEAQGTVPDAHDPSKRHAPMMLTTDLALRVDPIYGPIAKRFHENPDQLADAFAKAWYKLLHRDMGPVSRYLGPWVPEPQLWQDPVPAVDHELIGDAGHRRPQGARSSPRACPSRSWSRTAWASAASFRGTDKRGGANGARIRLAPQKDWEVNEPAELAKVLQALEQIQQDFNGSQSGGKKVSLADLIVLGGCAAVEQAAKNAGHDVTVPFAPGRTDASQEQTDVESFAVLEPTADGFRNYLRAGEKLSPETLLLDRAYLLTLTAPEMTVLVGGMRALNANVGQSKHGVFTDRPGTLTNDFFVNLLDMGTEWKAVGVGRERVRGSRSRDGRGQVDRHRRRPRLRLELPAPRARRGLRQRRREGEVRARLRRGVGQGHEPRSVRPARAGPGRASARRGRQLRASFPRLLYARVTREGLPRTR